VTELSIFDYEPDIVAYALLREKQRTLRHVPAHFSMDDYLAAERLAYPRFTADEWSAETELEDRWIAAGRPIFTDPEKSNLLHTLAQHGLCMVGP
jgi:hypothetical protein